MASTGPGWSDCAATPCGAADSTDDGMVKVDDLLFVLGYFNVQC